MDESTNALLEAFRKMIRPLTATAPPPAAALVADAIERLQASGSPGQENENVTVPTQSDADLLKKLEMLKADEEALMGFYAVMAVMAAAVGIAESIKKGITENKVNQACIEVESQVLKFAKSIDSLLKDAFPAQANSPQRKQLATMAKAAMAVSFQYLQGQGKGQSMTSSLSHSMMIWSRTAHSGERLASQEKLEQAMGCFLDSLIDQLK